MSTAGPERPTPPRDYGPQLVGLLVFAVALWGQGTGAFAGRFLGDGLNLVLGKALARGDGLTWIHLPGMPAAAWVHPLYPLLVASVGKVWPSFPHNLILIQIVDSALLGAAAWLVAIHARVIDMSRLSLYGIVGAAFLSAAILSLAVTSFSQPLLLLLCASAAVAAERMRPSWRVALFVGVLSGAAALTGYLGIPVAVGIGASFAIRRRPGLAVLVIAVAATVAGPWYLWSATRVDASGLATDIVHIARHATGADRGFDYLGFGTLTSMAFAGVPGWLRVLGGTLLSGFAVFGAVRAAASAPVLVSVWVSAMLGAAVLPSISARSVWVLLPWCALLGALGVYRVWGMRRSTRLAVLVGALVVIAAYLPNNLYGVMTRRFVVNARSEEEFLGKLVNSINAEVSDSAVIASDGEALIHLYTGHTVVPLTPAAWAGDTDQLVTRYCDTGVTYLVRTRLAVPDTLSDAALSGLGSRVTRVFQITNGPSLHRFACDR